MPVNHFDYNENIISRQISGCLECANQLNFIYHDARQHAVSREHYTLNDESW